LQGKDRSIIYTSEETENVGEDESMFVNRTRGVQDVDSAEDDEKRRQ